MFYLISIIIIIIITILVFLFLLDMKLNNKRIQKYSILNYQMLRNNRKLIYKLVGVGAAAAFVTCNYFLNDSLQQRQHSTSDLTNQIIKPNEKLISVQLLTRHGARTPIHLISGLEEVLFFNSVH
jgi:hypothetical protein